MHNFYNEMFIFVTGIVSIPTPQFKRGGHYVARFLHFCFGHLNTPFEINVLCFNACLIMLCHRA